MKNGHFGRSFFGLSVAVAAICALPASAQQAPARHYALSAQSLGNALRAIALASGQTIVAPADLVAGKRSRALTGNYSAEDAVARLLDGSGLVVVRVGDALVIQRQSAESAQGAQGDREGVGNEAILVTGTRIRGRAPAGASVITIDRKAIERSGYATTEQLLRALPQNFGGGPNETAAQTGRSNADFNMSYGSAVNLRGLGPSSTLVLLNGERPPMSGLAGVFADLSMVPLTAIERIEVLPDGASALYGSDAVAGVVNIVPRTRFEGLQTTGRLGLANGFHEAQLGAVVGTRWSSGHFVLAYEFYRRSPLRAADRPFVSEDLRRYGLGDFRSAPGLPGTITAGGRVFGIPAGQDGTALNVADLLPGQANRSDRFLGAYALPEQRRHAVYASFEQGLAGNLDLYAQALFGARDFENRMPAAANARTVTVPVTNAFYVDPVGTRQPIQVGYSFVREFGAEGERGSARALGATAGLRWSLGTWQVDAHGTYGRQREIQVDENLINSARLAAALADGNRATAFNVFGDGTANNPATIDRIRGSATSGGRYRMWTAALRADGPLLALPAGDLRVALGAEHRDEAYRGDVAMLDYATLTPIPLASPPLDGRRRVSAAYAELVLPLSNEQGGGLGIGRLDVSAALRGEHYSDVGDTLNPKLGASWEPVSGLVLRATYGTSFRAPNFNELRQDPDSNFYFAYPVPDPASPGGITNALIIRGNDPNLKPETATSWTAGIDYRQSAASGPHAQLTFFSVNYRDRIATPASALFSFFVQRSVYAPIINAAPSAATIAAYYASPLFKPLTPVPASAVTAIVDARTQNLARQNLDGIDFDLGYRFAFADAAEIGVSGSYLLGFSQQITTSAPSFSVVDTVGYPVDLRLRGRATISESGLGAALFVNYVDGYRNQSSGTVRKVASWTTLDLQLSYRFGESRGALSGLSLSLSATNLLDADPPHLAYALGTLTIGYDAENASPLGRVIGFQVTKQW